MYTIGRLCMKVAGRDAGKYCLIVDEKDDRVLIDGQTRRRSVNPEHLEPLKQTADIKKGASHAVVVKALKDLGIVVEEAKSSPKSTSSKATPKKDKE